MKKITEKFINTDKLPVVIEPEGSMTLQNFLRLLETDNDYFKSLLLKYGGILFRNFPISNAEHFGEVIKHLKTGNFIDYIGGDSPRTKIRDGIYTSTEAPPSIKIPLHNELSFVKYYPSHIYFFCETPPIAKGETIIADARKIYQAINPEVRERFIKKKLKYVSCYYHKSRFMELINSIQKGHKSWLDVFETGNKDEVERKCLANEFAFKWNQNDWIQISQTRPAAIEHPHTKEMIWFNQAHLYDFNPRLLGFWRYLGAKILYARKHMRLHEVFFADGSQIPLNDLYHVLDVLDKNTIAFPWQKGDVMVLDNVLSMHGRATFQGKRRVLAAMTGS